MRERATATLTTVIVDDEELACDELAYLLRDFPEVEVVATGRNGLEAVQSIRKAEPDLAWNCRISFCYSIRSIRRRGFPHGGDGLPAEAGG